MENLIFFLIMEGGSALFFYLGFLLWKKEKITIIHDYHYTKVKETDKKAYTNVMGKAMIVIGIGLLISGIIGMFTDSVKSGIPFGIAFIVGLCMMLFGQIKYNHGIKYLKTLGFSVTNDIFAENSWYFRNALVRANYTNLQKGIHETTEYLEVFLWNLLLNEKNELHDIYM